MHQEIPPAKAQVELRRPLRPSLFLALALWLGLGFSFCARGQTQNRIPGDFDPAVNSHAHGATPTNGTRVHSARDEQGHWTPTEFSAANPKLPTLFIAGDSTASTGDPRHRGWGAVLADFFNTNEVNVINRARGGRSFRSFYREGLWQQIVDALKPGDFVVIEFGHNDGGGVANKGRGDVPGSGDQTESVTWPDGTVETVHTFDWYARKFVRDVKAKGATPIVSSTTVRNIWKDGKVERGMGHMLEWARQVAREEHVPFLDHSNITADRYEKMGQEEVARFFPADHTHTSTEGAILNAETFIAGLKALPGQPLVQYLNQKGRAVPAATKQGADD